MIGIQASAQSIEEIDSLRRHILQNKNQLESFRYSKKEILNEDAVSYDTLCFYTFKNELVYVNRKVTSHTFHLSGDAIDFTEFFLLDEKVVFKRRFGYQFKNPQWHLEPDINKARVIVTESHRAYYNKKGKTIMEYKGREVEGDYKNRFVLLDTIPLKEVNSFIWEDHCEECFEEDYMELFKTLNED